MRRLTTLTLCAALWSAGVTPAAGQSDSPIDQLIGRAQRALDDLDYARAQTIARTLLDMEGTAAQRTTGLQLIVAAFYPEEPGAQRLDSAQRYLRELVRVAPDASVPRSVSWPGLDSLFVLTRRATFAVWSTPEGTHTLGADDVVEIGVTASRDATFRLSAVPEGSTDTLSLDAAGPAPAAGLRLPVFAADRPVFAWGRYTLVITGTDTLSGERMPLTFTATVDAPPFELVFVPSALDSTALLPERGPRRTQRNLLIGLGVGAATAFAATLVAGSDDVASAMSPTRAYTVGFGMAAGALLGVLTNRGALLNDNVDHNARVEEQFQTQLRQRRAENARRRSAYRATITIEGEPR